MKLTLKVFRKYTFWAGIGTLFGILIHIGLVWIDSTMLEKPIYLDLEKKFWQSAFSFPFLPILVIEILLTVSTVFLWITMRKAIKRAHDSDMKMVNYDTTVKTFQGIMSLLAQYIGSNNNKILDKIEFRKSQGQQTSEIIEKSSKNISLILKVLSEISFVEPYISKEQKTDLLKELEKRIQEIELN